VRRIGVAPERLGATLREVPTTKPRYTLTDTGHLAELLDAATHRWPDIGDRKQLLLRLAEEGHQALAAADGELVARDRRDRRARALERIPSLLDRDQLLSDDAWK
jgi:hypothetical protein